MQKRKKSWQDCGNHQQNHGHGSGCPLFSSGFTSYMRGMDLHSHQRLFVEFQVLPERPLPSNWRHRPVLLAGAVAPGQALCAEMAGSTAADCAAICCCCPCGLLSLVALVAVKLPAGLCRLFFLRRQQRKKKMAIILRTNANQGSSPRGGLLEDGEEERVAEEGGRPSENTPAAEVSEMEKMWPQFTTGGFWRSASARTT